MIDGIGEGRAVEGSSVGPAVAVGSGDKDGTGESISETDVTRIQPDSKMIMRRYCIRKRILIFVFYLPDRLNFSNILFFGEDITRPTDQSHG